jgi:hypothetical protein
VSMSALWSLGAPQEPEGFAAWGEAISEAVDGLSSTGVNTVWSLAGLQVNVDHVADNELNAKAFGAVGDGTTNDTAALADGLAAAAAQNKTLVVPPGNYRCVDVVIPAGCSVRGFGAATTLSRVSTGIAGLSNVLRVNGSNVSISDLTLDGNKAGVASADNRGVIDGSLADVDNVSISNCTISNGAEKGIRFVNHGSGLSINNCRIIDCDEDAIIIQQTSQDGSDVSVIGCDISTTVSGAGGILCRGSNDGITWFQRRVVIANNRVVLPISGAGLCIEQWCEDCSITGNVTDGGSFGISNGPGHRTAITGNTVRRATTIGIEAAADEADFSTCAGNVVDCNHVTLTGISCSVGINRVVITGNTIRYPNDHGIHLTDVTEAIVNDNSILSDSTTDGTPYGIRFQSGTDVVCNGNMIDGTTPNAGVGDNGIFFGDITNLTCVGNMVKNHRNGIRLVSAVSAYAGAIVGNTLRGNTNNYADSLTGTANKTLVIFGSNAPTI